MRAVVAEAIDSVRKGIAASSIEEVCRYVVAQVMEDEERLLFDEEVMDIVEPTVKDETYAVAEDLIDGDQAYMTNNEWDSLDESEKAMDKSGNRYLVSAGKIYLANVREDQTAAQVASAIIGDMKASITASSISDGVNYDFASMCIKSDRENRTCPSCGSKNTDAVWYDDGMVVSHCHDCMEDFEAAIDEETSTVEEQTIEDIELGNEMFASIYFDDEEDMWAYEIWADGELIHSNLCSDPDEAHALIDSFVSEYNSIEVGEVLKSTETGDHMEIEDIDGDDLTIDGKVASRAKIAMSKVAGRLISDKSGVKSIIAKAGDVYKNANGDSIVITAANGNTYEYEEISTNAMNGMVQNIYASCNERELSDMLAGYELQPTETKSAGWGDFKDPVADEVNDKYLPPSGEGDNMATQIAAAVNKLIYKYFNDGDHYDTNNGFETWNDLSSYANWLHENVPELAIYLRAGVQEYGSEDRYEYVLKKIYDKTLCNPEFMDEMAQRPATGSIYNAFGPFSCPEPEEEEWWEEEEEDWDDWF